MTTNKAKRDAIALRYIATARFNRQEAKRHLQENIAVSVLGGSILLLMGSLLYTVWSF
jgi:uncharacterized protein with ATP-grasp and redox domains